MEFYWVEEILSVMRVYRTTPRTATWETPFNLLYGFETVLPVEIGITTARVKTYHEGNDQVRAQELDLVDEKKRKGCHRYGILLKPSYESL